MSKWKKLLISSFYFQIARKNQNDNFINLINFCVSQSSLFRDALLENILVFMIRRKWYCKCVCLLPISVKYTFGWFSVTFQVYRKKVWGFFVFVLFVFLSPSLFDWNLYEQCRIFSSPILQSWTWLRAIINLPFNFICRALKASWLPRKNLAIISLSVDRLFVNLNLVSMLAMMTNRYITISFLCFCMISWIDIAALDLSYLICGSQCLRPMTQRQGLVPHHLHIKHKITLQAGGARAEGIEESYSIALLATITTRLDLFYWPSINVLAVRLFWNPVSY